MIAILTAFLFSTALVVAVLSIAWMLYSDGQKMMAALRLEHRVTAPAPVSQPAYRRSSPARQTMLSRPARALRAA